MGAGTITLRDPEARMRERQKRAQRERAARAMQAVASELLQEWREQVPGARYDVLTWAQHLALELAGKPIPALVRTADSDALHIVLTRFSVAVRRLPPVGPDMCPECQGQGFMPGPLADGPGSVCPVCRGACAIGEQS